MEARLNYADAAPDAFKAVLALEHYVAGKSGLDPHYIHLLKLRASQINGCAYCVDMHTKEARKSGLSEQWISLVCVWHEAGIFDDRERALLRWTEALTNIRDGAPSDEDYDEIRRHFSEAEITKLSVAIGTINLWNRIAVGFRSQHPIDKTA